jgi:hypothetical protein
MVSGICEALTHVDETFTELGRIASVALAAMLFASEAAKAEVLYQANLSALGQFDTLTPLKVDFTAGAGPATLAFQLAGFRSLDGFGDCCTDTLHISLDSVEFFTGAFNLGGGDNVALFNPLGGTFRVASPGNWQGGTVDFSCVTSFLPAGSHRLTFSFTVDFQRFDDEAWGINTISVNGSPRSRACRNLRPGR